MALKGITKIELTNVKTGEVEILQETNMVTNAISDILNTDPMCLKWGGGVDFRENMLPVIGKLIGGIVLFEDTLNEVPDSYYAPGNNQIIGYSNMAVSSSTDVLRGSMNQTESGALDDGTGYRFVFDFANTQGNGKISAVALTSPHMGACGYGSAVYNDHAYGSTYADAAKTSLVFPVMGEDFAEMGDQKSAKLGDLIAWVDFQNDAAYALFSEGTKRISVYKFKLPCNKFGLLSNKVIEAPELYRTLETTVFRETTSTSYSTYNYYAFCDGGDGYIWGFEGTANAEKTTTIRWIKISKEDWTFTEGSWSVPISVYAGGKTMGGMSSGYSFDCETKSIVADGLAYFIGGNNKSIVIVNTENPTDITTLTSEKDLSPRDSGVDSWLNTLGAAIRLSGAYIVNRKLYEGPQKQQNYYPAGLCYTGRPNIKDGPVGYSFSDYSTSIRVRMYLDNSYLATINNLQNPVQKTADKTMKITYILREES